MRMRRQKSFEESESTLYLVATPIGNLEEITYRAINVLKSVDVIAAEDTRNTIKLLNHFDIKTKLMSHHEHNLSQSIPKIMTLLKEGKSVALVSDAGYPAISDPGYELVQQVIQEDIPVVSVSGANACLNALVVSGISPQPFLFYGFLHHQDKQKKKELEKLQYEQATLVFYESPHRIKKTLELMKVYFGNRQMALCRELTKRHEEILRGNIEDIIEVLDTVKGEMVLIVQGCQDENIQEEIFDISISDHVDEWIQQGFSTKDAIKKVAELRKMKKNEVYAAYHRK